MTNRLSEASSPYLRQHRDNPVDWHQWGPEAFEEARRTGRPILLSVGYSACHWCHVMAHESFEHEETARVMNELFVNIKVDREERPDVDAVYMDAVQALTGRGGWPMTVFCTPEGEPFYGGTYYPRDTFVKLMRAVDDAWTNRRDELRQNVDALVEAIGRTAQVAPADSIDANELLGRAIGGLQQNFDAAWGGFGGAPKFPSTFNLDLLLHVGMFAGDDELVSMVRTSLDAMAAGGMYDQLGGGYCRYSVDEKWLVPHFEKMLYDQALLLRAHVHAWGVQHLDRDEQVAREIVGYVLAHLTSPEGGFYSAEDADSIDEHGHSEEGAFYTWTVEEFRDVLGDEADDALAYWSVTAEGNFEGRNILHRMHHRGDIARDARVESWRRRLEQHRVRRQRPGLDDKVLTEWNAMMTSSLCEAARAFGDADMARAAVRNGEFLLANLRSADGRWHRSWQAEAVPPARHDALAHDLAHVVDAMTRLHELTGEGKWLDVAHGTARLLRREHWDDEHGGVFTVSTEGEQLIVRQKDLMDNATASANSMTALAYLRLSRLVDDHGLAADADAILRLLARVAPSAPSAFGHALHVLLMRTRGMVEVVIPGPRSDFHDVYDEMWRPDAVLAWGKPGTSSLWQGRVPGQAYVCRDAVCGLPAGDAETLRSQLLTTSNGG